MLIGVDGNEANIENCVGVNVYAFELLQAIYKLQDEWKKSHRFVVYLRKKPLKNLPQETKYWKYKVLSGKGLWIITRLMPDLFLSREKPDIFFSPSHYVPPLSPMPRVCSIMDLGYLEFSGQFTKYDYWQLKLWSAWSLFVSKYIIAISKATKDDIVRHYPFARKKVFITPLAYDKNRFNQKVPLEDVRRSKKHYSILEDYIIYLGTLKPSKNIKGLITAWSKICKSFPNVELVIAGKKGWLYDEIFKEVGKLNIKSRVLFTGFVDEKDKAPLIVGARAFILPSFWEGFGLDVLSAMACGVVVISSNRGSLPEVAGDAAILVDPENTQELSGAIKKVLNLSKKEYNRLVERGISQAAEFSWEKTARETLKILERTR